MTSLTAPPIYNTNQISQVKTHTLRGKITGRWFPRSTATVPNLHRHEHSSTFRSIIISSPFRSLIFFFKICKIEILWIMKWFDFNYSCYGMVIRGRAFIQGSVDYARGLRWYSLVATFWSTFFPPLLLILLSYPPGMVSILIIQF